MGDLYRNGYGVAKDIAEARRWYEKAVAAGYESAKSDLASLDEQSKPAVDGSDEEPRSSTKKRKPRR